MISWMIFISAAYTNKTVKFMNNETPYLVWTLKKILIFVENIISVKSCDNWVLQIYIYAAGEVIECWKYDH